LKLPPDFEPLIPAHLKNAKGFVDPFRCAISQPNVTTNPPRLRFSVSCYFEIGLLIIALVLGTLFDHPVSDHWEWNLKDALLGSLAAIPPLVLILGLTCSNWPPFLGLRRVVEVRIRPLFVGWSWWQLGVLSILVA